MNSAAKNHVVDRDGVVVGGIPTRPRNVAMSESAWASVGLTPPQNPRWVRVMGAKIARAGQAVGARLNR